MSDERVLVVPTKMAVGPDPWHGMRPADPGATEALVARHGRYVARAAAERDPSLKQIIPYLVLRDGRRYFLMRRTRAGADERLHDRWSIGVGGHLNEGDGGLAGGLRREWSEELDAGFDPEPRFVGLLNDDSTDVGAVHLGAVYVADAAGRPVRVRETDKLAGSFADPAAVAEVRDGLETWSRLVFEYLEAGMR